LAQLAFEFREVPATSPGPVELVMPVQVYPGLFVGPGIDAQTFYGHILHCAKEPWFMDSLVRLVKYKKGIEVCPTAIRISDREMALNMIDAENLEYFSDEMVNAGLDFITETFAEGESILLHCNQGLSRSPSMAFLWMFEHGFLDKEFRYAVPQFKKLYHDWSPGNGIWAYLRHRCTKVIANDFPFSE
jgi:hypothetical protein